MKPMIIKLILTITVAVAITVLYGIVSWHILERPTFFSEGKNCMPLIGKQPVPGLQEKIFGAYCAVY